MMEMNMPMLLWLPLIILGGMLSVACDAATGSPAGPTGEPAPARAKRAASRNQIER